MHMLPHYVMKLFDTRHCHVKKIENRLRFDKVTRMSLVSSFFMGRGVVPILSLQHLPRSTCFLCPQFGASSRRKCHYFDDTQITLKHVVG